MNRPLRLALAAALAAAALAATPASAGIWCLPRFHWETVTVAGQTHEYPVYDGVVCY
jgi:hypothetical protein